MLRTFTKLANLASACALACASLTSAALTSTALASNYTWTVTGGTGDWFATGDWNPSGPPTSSFNAYVVDGGTAVIAQSGAACSTLNIGGTNTGWVQIDGGGLADTYLQLGTVKNGASGAGTLALSSGTLNTLIWEYIGLSGIGTFMQSGGTNTAVTLDLGSNGSGTYNLSSGLLIATSSEYISAAGTGYFTQSGGTNTTPNLEFGDGANFGSGTYSLNGGLLNISALTRATNDNATLDAGGGTLQAALSLATSVPMMLTGNSGDAYFSANGNTLTLNGALSGSGGLQKIGAGMLVLTASNTYLGNTTVSAGTLQVSAGRLPGNWEYVSGSGGAALVVSSSGSNVIAAGLEVGNNASESGSYSLGIGGQLSSAGGETVGNFGTGLFTQSGGSNSVSSTLNVGNGSGSYGTYNMQGGTLAANQESIGLAGSGTFTQTGGSNSVSTTLYVGNGSGSYGTYNMQGGTLTANQESIGGMGIGLFTQSGGRNSVSTYLNVGNGSGYYETYNMQGGTLVANQESIGLMGNGLFTQSGGRNSVSTTLNVGNGSGSYGTYNMQEGTLAANQESIGLTGYGLFTQSGGSNSVSTTLYVGNGSGSYGTYNMQGGTLAANQESIGLTGTGTFTQTGGTHTVIGSFILAENLSSKGTYDLAGGTLSCQQIAGGAGISILNLDGGKLVAAPGANSNFISGLSALTVGNSATATYTQSSGSNNVGVLYLGFNASAGGSYNLNTSGALNATSEFIGTSGSGSLTQSGGTNTSSALVVGLEAGASGSYKLNGSGVLICNSDYPDYESIGYQGSGNFAQSGGTNNTNILYIGAGVGGNGTYSLNGGTLTSQQVQGGAGTSALNLDGGLLLAASGASSNFISGLTALTVGKSATASYTQSSGNNDVGTLYLGFNSTGNGTYSLNGGTLACQQIQGGAGTSTLILDGGVLLPAASTNSNFISGLGTLTVGYSATTSYAQSFSSINVGNLYLGFNPSASGSYNLGDSAALSVSGNEYVGYSGSGSFTQSGGTNNTNGLELGCGASARGSYNLSGPGVLNASGWESIGSVGRASFTQSAGTNNAAYLQLGQMASGNGTYNLKGGLLSCGQVLGGAGMSTFNFNGGVLQAAAGASSNFMSGLTAAYVKSGGAAIDTNGQTVTINQTLLDGGGGGMSVTGGGTLILANSNTYAGGTTLNGGWLVASNGAQGSATGSGPMTVYNGGLAAGPAGGTITGPVTLGAGALSGIQPGAFFNRGSNILNLLGGLIIENGSELYYTLNLSSSISSGRNSLPVYGGDLINLGGSNLYVVNGSIAFSSNPTLPGDYRLIADVSNSNSVNFAALAPPTVAGETFAWSTAVDPGYIDLVASGILGASGGTWVSPVSGSWKTPTNWSCNPGIPFAGTVWFPGALSAAITATLDGNQTAGALVFNVSTGAPSGSGYTLAQGCGGTLTLGTAAGASIAILGGSHTISAPIVLAGSLTASVASGASLQMAGLLSETATGTSVTFTGPGLTTFSGTGTYTGNTNVYGGTLQINPGAQWSNSFDWQIGGATGACVVQQGGNNSLANRLCVGLSPSMSGSYNLSAGGLWANVESIPLGGTGIFNQTGGTNTVGVGMTLGGGLGGAYNLNGGILTTSSLSLGGNNAAFNAGGGTFQAGASFATSVPMTLTGLYGPAVFDSNGYALTLAGSLSGSGGLTAGLPLESGYPLAGGGTLTLAAQNSYRGPTTLNASMLVVANGSVGSATGTNSVTLNGGTLAAGPLGTITGAVYGGSGPHMIAPGAGLPAGQFGTLRLTDGLTTNANTTLLFDLGAPVTGGAYSGDLIDLGNSALTVGANTSIAFVINPMQPGDYRLFANVGNSSSLANFTLPRQSGQNYTLSTGVDPGFVDLVDTLSTGSGYYWIATSGDWTSQGNWSPSGWPTSKDTCYVQNGGTASVSQGSDAGACGTLYVGTASGSGAVAMSAGVLASAIEYIGYSGNGTFNQSGGVHAVSSALFLGYAPGSTGSYNLNGGLLQLGLLSEGSGNVTFNASGGTFRAMDSFATSVPMTLTGTYGPAVFDTNGNTLTLSGSLSGNGGLEKIGTGELVLTGTNKYGGTTVEDGTLIVTNNEALADGSSLVVGNPSLFGTVSPAARSSDASWNASGIPTGHPLAGPGTTSAVPEPGTLALLAAAGALLLLHRRKKIPASDTQDCSRGAIQLVDNTFPLRLCSG